MAALLSAQRADAFPLLDATRLVNKRLAVCFCGHLEAFQFGPAIQNRLEGRVKTELLTLRLLTGAFPSIDSRGGCASSHQLLANPAVLGKAGELIPNVPPRGQKVDVPSLLHLYVACMPAVFPWMTLTETWLLAT
jgi:hypothetical protein